MIHRSASDGYTASSETYARGRPGYPPEALDWLREVLELRPARTVLEVGAGTGKFLPLLLDSGAEVIALEPVEAMRAEIGRRFPVTLLGGRADRIGLSDATVDAVVCAQSFHWFATHAAVAEMRRVLKPGGTLGLIWNVRDTTVPWVAAISAILDPYEDDTPRFHTGRWRDVLPAAGLMPLGERHARNLHLGSPDRVIVDRVLSTSFIAALPAATRHAIAARVRALIAETPDLANRAEVAHPYDTVMVAFRKDRG